MAFKVLGRDGEEWSYNRSGLLQYNRGTFITCKSWHNIGCFMMRPDEIRVFAYIIIMEMEKNMRYVDATDIQDLLLSRTG